MSTAAEKRHMVRVAQLSCGLCGAEGVEVHHIREGQGGAQRASDFLTVPVCPSCHRGPKGIHGDRTMLRIKKWGEIDLLADTLRRLAA